MGAFLLVRKSSETNTSSLTERALTTLSRQGLDTPTVIERDEYKLYLYKKVSAPVDNWVEHKNGDFCASTGTLLFRGLTGKDALRKIYDVFDPNALHNDRLYGAFCLIVRKNAKTYVIIDRLGIYKTYVDEEQLLWSSSFLAICSGLTHLQVDTQSVYEYVFQGATYGNSTLFRNISLLDSEKVYQLDKRVATQDRAGRLRAKTSSQPIDDQVAQCLDGLRTYYKDIVTCFGNSIDTAISGGYDSRLTLALLLEQGSRPKVHVYGKSSDSDVVVARQIDVGENLGLIHTDKTNYPKPNADDFSKVVQNNFFSFDACPPDGIFDSGSDLATRYQRCANGELMLNGGGGEIYRNFFYLRNSSFTVRQLLWAFYSRFDPSVCTEQFSERSYHSLLGEKIKFTLAQTEDKLTRTSVESIYPLFRCRYWMGNNNSINNRLGSALTPFIDYAIVKDALSVPLQAKNFGQFEANLINAVSPDLAAYDSSYGHNFVGKVPTKRKLQDCSTYAKPTIMRRYVYRLKMKLKDKDVPYFLSAQYLKNVLKDEFPNMSYFFRVAQVRDDQQYNRICTLEYLLQEYGAKVTSKTTMR